MENNKSTVDRTEVSISYASLVRESIWAEKWTCRASRDQGTYTKCSLGCGLALIVEASSLASHPPFRKGDRGELILGIERWRHRTSTHHFSHPTCKNLITLPYLVARKGSLRWASSNPAEMHELSIINITKWHSEGTSKPCHCF